VPQASVVTNSTASPYAASLPFVCTCKAGGLDSAWVEVAGELDLATSPQLRQTLGDALRHVRVVVLDLRKLTFIDTSGVHVVLDAARGARLEGGRVLLVRGPALVDRVLTLTGVADEVMIFDLDPAEPAQELLDLAWWCAAA
jgi:anti-sigma B factor antagonist